MTRPRASSVLSATIGTASMAGKKASAAGGSGRCSGVKWLLWISGGACGPPAPGRLRQYPGAFRGA